MQCLLPSFGISVAYIWIGLNEFVGCNRPTENGIMI